MNLLVSVIVPVYNVDKYLRECVESILRQTYKMVEVILVDDGSKDSSGEICDEYAEKYPKILVIHQKNQGLSGARNSGVRLSKGEYITFIDSDDIVSDDFVETMVNAISGDCDVVASGMVKFSETIPNYDKKVTEIQKLSNEEALKILCNQTKFGNSACAKLYKRYLVEKYPYPLGKLHEDLATTHKIIGDAKSIIYCSKCGYFYRQRSDSIMNHHGIEDRDWDALKAAKQQHDYICKHYPGASAPAKGRCVVAGFDLLKLIRNRSKEDKKCFKRIKAYVKPLKKDVLKSNDVIKKTKLKCQAICLGYYPAIVCSALFDFMRKKVKK